MIRKWRGGCDRYVRERDSPGGNELRTRRVNIKERKQLTGLFHLPLRDVHIWFGPLLYTSTRLRDADLGLWWWYPEAERYLLGPWGWWIQSLMNNDTDFQMLHPSWIDVWCSDAHLTRAADILTKLCFSSRPHNRQRKIKRADELKAYWDHITHWFPDVLKTFVSHSVNWILNGVLASILICMCKYALLPGNSCCMRKTDKCWKKRKEVIKKIWECH